MDSGIPSQNPPPEDEPDDAQQRQDRERDRDREPDLPERAELESEAAEEAQAGPEARAPRHGPTTSWTMLWAAGDSEAARKELLDVYYDFFLKWCRRRWPAGDEGQDVLHDWLTSQFDTESPFASVDPAKGSFRNWCYRGLRNCFIKRLQRANAAKRGGLHGTMALEEQVEQAGEAEGHGADPRRDFDRGYAVQLMRVATARVLAAWPADGVEQAILRRDLMEDEVVAEAIQAQYGISKPDYYRRRRRLKADLKQEVWDEVARGLDHPTHQEIEDEMRHLFGSL